MSAFGDYKYVKHDRLGSETPILADVIAMYADRAIEELWAALAALRSQRCEGCEHVKHHAVGTPHAYRLCALGNSYGYDAALPDDFACNRWTARAKEGGEDE